MKQKLSKDVTRRYFKDSLLTYLLIPCFCRILRVYIVVTCRRRTRAKKNEQLNDGYHDVKRLLEDLHVQMVKMNSILKEILKALGGKPRTEVLHMPRLLMMKKVVKPPFFRKASGKGDLHKQPRRLLKSMRVRSLTRTVRATSSPNLRSSSKAF